MLHELPDSEPVPPTAWTNAISPWLVAFAVHLLVAISGALLVYDFGLRKAPEVVLVLRQARPTEVQVFHARALDDSFEMSVETQPFLAVDPPELTESLTDSPTKDEFSPLEATVPLQPIEKPSARAPQVTQRQRPAKTTRVFLPADPRDVAAILAEDAKVPREQVPTGTTARLSLFGLPAAEGRSFVFVIDRSASMGVGGLNVTGAAAKELAARLDELSSEQRFQVVAYNQSVAYLTSRELISATDENKRRLVDFVARLPAFGQTEHSRGLLAAVRLKPDVIFILTDGGDPVLHPGQLRAIREETAGRTCIYCIRFGRGPETEPLSFLARLAAENHGSYVYIDVNAR